MTGQIQRRGDTCQFVEAVDSGCPKDARCNPPEPYRMAVACEPGLSPPTYVTIVESGGKCGYDYELPDNSSMNCPPNFSCNPPPPETRHVDVKCPW